MAVDEDPLDAVACASSKRIESYNVTNTGERFDTYIIKTAARRHLSAERRCGAPGAGWRFVDHLHLRPDVRRRPATQRFWCWWATQNRVKETAKFPAWSPPERAPVPACRLALLSPQPLSRASVSSSNPASYHLPGRARPDRARRRLAAGTKLPYSCRTARAPPARAKWSRELTPGSIRPNPVAGRTGRRPSLRLPGNRSDISGESTEVRSGQRHPDPQAAFA